MNTYENLTFNDIIDSAPKRNYNIKEYHHILSPDYPDFLDKYINLPIMQRLKGIGLLCGSDWTKLFHNRIFYSRLDHSVGVALIVWHFTHDKAQTIAGLLHDISTPVFSHVSDFRKGDALTQTATEGPTASMIRGDKELQQLLAADGIKSSEVEDYHMYPIADNEIPQLSADRLEYMFPSGMALEGSWTMEEIERAYNDLLVLTNENGQEELGFQTLKTAEMYCQKFCMTGHILQMNEDKMTLHMLGQIMNRAVEEGLVGEEDFMTLSEQELLDKLETGLKSKENVQKLARLYYTFRNMEQIEHTGTAFPEEDYFCINLKVKQRYINPLVKTDSGKTCRLYDISPSSKKIINDFLAYKDTPYGCVKLI